MKFTYEIEKANGYSIVHMKGQITQRLETENLVDYIESMIADGQKLYVQDNGGGLTAYQFD